MELRGPKPQSAGIQSDRRAAALSDGSLTRANVTELAALVRSIGTPTFVTDFGRCAQTRFGAEQATVIRVQADGCVSLLYGQNFRHANLMNELWDVYAKRFCRLDPLLGDSATAGALRPSVRYVSSGAVSDREYYKRLFRLPGLVGKLSTVAHIGSDSIFINLYRGSRAPEWRTADVGFMEAFATTAAAVEAHFRATLGAEERREVASAMPQAFLKLSPRERELCRHILRGLSLEGVAIEMDVSLNTAATFKRRAFAKLRISTLKELFHLAFSRAMAEGTDPLRRMLS